MTSVVSHTSSPTHARFSFVLEHPAAETDPSDVHLDLERGNDGITVIDARGADAFAQCHVPGAISLPHRTISESTTAGLSRYRTLVVYCWGPGCNAATKAAAKLAALGFRVKEMIGGLEYWRREGHAVEGTLGDAAPMVG